MSVALADHGGVLRRVHAGEVEHGNVRLTIVIHGEVQRRQLVIGGEVGSLAGVRLQCILVYVPPREKQLSVCKVLMQEEEIFVLEAELQSSGVFR